MTQNTQKRPSKKPGTGFITRGIVVLVVGLILLMFNLTNPVSNYVTGVGMVETQGPSVGSIVLIVGGLLLAAFGFCKRLLAAVEK